MLSDFKEDFHGLLVILNHGEPKEILLHFVPLALSHQFLKVTHVEVTARLRFQSILTLVIINLFLNHQFGGKEDRGRKDL